MQEQTFQLTGLTCESCARFTIKRIKRINAVKHVSVDLATMVATVTAERPLDKQEIRSALEGTHYGVTERTKKP